MSNIEQLKSEGLAARVTWDFGSETLPIDDGQAECPVCEGKGRISVPDAELRNYRATYGFDESTLTAMCRNCGGQKMSLKPTGRVPRRADGTPCTHDYTYRLAGRCYHEYTCKHCPDKFYIDSGD